MFCYLFYNSLVKPKRKYSLSWIGCESKHDLQKKPVGKPGFFTWAFPWMWSRIKQNKLETLVSAHSQQFGFSGPNIVTYIVCLLPFNYWMKLHVVIIWGIMQIEEGVMAIVYTWHPPRSVQFFKSYERQHSKHSKEFFLLHIYSFLWFLL